MQKKTITIEQKLELVSRDKVHEKDDDNNLHIKMVKILTGSRFFFDLTEDTEERRAHPMDIQRLLPETQ